MARKREWDLCPNKSLRKACHVVVLGHEEGSASHIAKWMLRARL